MVMNDRISVDTEFYCPACSETSTMPALECLSPGYIDVTCPCCSTEWVVKIAFYEKTSMDERYGDEG